MMFYAAPIGHPPVGITGTNALTASRGDDCGDGGCGDDEDGYRDGGDDDGD